MYEASSQSGQPRRWLQDADHEDEDIANFEKLLCQSKGPGQVSRARARAQWLQLLELELEFTSLNENLL